MRFSLGRYFQFSIPRLLSVLEVLFMIFIHQPPLFIALFMYRCLRAFFQGYRKIFLK